MTYKTFGLTLTMENGALNLFSPLPSLIHLFHRPRSYRTRTADQPPRLLNVIKNETTL